VDVVHHELCVKDVYPKVPVQHKYLDVVDKCVPRKFDDYEVSEKTVNVTCKELCIRDVEKFIPIEHEMVQIIEKKELVDIDDVTLRVIEE
tara:strand:- start:494 stop:763 length:270 start_codon:yes stop_codon:yes gene_type:complete